MMNVFVNSCVVRGTNVRRQIITAILAPSGLSAGTELTCQALFYNTALCVACPPLHIAEKNYSDMCLALKLVMPLSPAACSWRNFGSLSINY